MPVPQHKNVEFSILDMKSISVISRSEERRNLKLNQELLTPRC